MDAMYTPVVIVSDPADVQCIFDDLSQVFILVDPQYSSPGHSAVTGHVGPAISPHNLWCLVWDGNTSVGNINGY